VSDSVEDEKHFLLTCPIYGRERGRMFEEIRERCEIDLENDYDYCYQNNNNNNKKKKNEGNDEMLRMMMGNGLDDDEEKEKEMKKIVSMYISKANKIRGRYV